MKLVAVASKANCICVFVKCITANKLGENVGWAVFLFYFVRCDDFDFDKLLCEEVSQLDALCFL